MSRLPRLQRIHQFNVEIVGVDLMKAYPSSPMVSDLDLYESFWSIGYFN